ncbi:hypothetical protein MTO98_06410 [Mucilaginibacter sp. SMC90]|uniref:hypothetical protein n=1 Tax=Mucilaginibacter sp. SMC90 TaxID=2929803 RepID=UPI001FB1AB22|nr:hypothetical protein [Mucilaginibacter sp. SMC90]UOE50706.1 hypothetical protein MTO98_06410 [Mucilaginibacter sp. SMC90]
MSGTVFSKISLFDMPGISLNRLVANVESKIVWELMVPELLRMVATKLIVSSSFEKSSFVYKTNLTVFVGGLTEGWCFSFLHETTVQTAVKIDKIINALLIF